MSATGLCWQQVDVYGNAVKELFNATQGAVDGRGEAPAEPLSLLGRATLAARREPRPPDAWRFYETLQSIVAKFFAALPFRGRTGYRECMK